MTITTNYVSFCSRGLVLCVHVPHPSQCHVLPLAEENLYSFQNIEHFQNFLSFSKVLIPPSFFALFSQILNFIPNQLLRHLILVLVAWALDTIFWAPDTSCLGTWYYFLGHLIKVAWALDTSCLGTWYYFFGHLIVVAWALDTSCLWVQAGVLEPTPQRRKLWSLHLAGTTLLRTKLVCTSSCILCTSSCSLCSVFFL